MRNHKTIGLAALALISALDTQQGVAGPLFLDFEGEITFVQDDLQISGLEPLDPSVVVGASFSGSVLYDPTGATDLRPDASDLGIYDLGASMLGQVGNTTFATEGSLYVWVFDTPNGDGFRITGQGNGQGEGFPFNRLKIILSGDNSIFDNDMVPGTLDLDDFTDSRDFLIWHEIGEDPAVALFWVQGTITSLTVIPEPGTLSLLALGAVLVTTRRTFFVRKRLRKPCSISCKTLVLLIVLGFIGGHTEATDSTEGPFVSIQVNVDANGNNTVGDAGNEPSIAIDPTDPNKMVIAFRHFFIIVGDNSRSDAGVAYSTDGGMSWTMDVLDPQPLNQNGERDSLRSDPVVDSNPAGDFYYYSLKKVDAPETRLCDFFISTNGGVTWTDPIPAHGGDKAWIAIDRTGGASDGFIYAYWDRFHDNPPPAGPLDRFTRSMDNGASFQGPVQIANMFDKIPELGNIDIDSNGDVYIVGRSQGSTDAFTVSKSTSLKNGNPETDLADDEFSSEQHSNWLGGKIRTGSSSSPNGPSTSALQGMPWIRADHSNDNVYVLCSVVDTLFQNDPLDVYFQRSEDGGATWLPFGSTIRVNDDPIDSNSWQWFGTMSVSPGGRIDVFYNHSPAFNPENDPTAHVRYTYSTDSGEIWSASIRVSQDFDPRIGQPDRSKKLGDYYESISFNDSVHLAYAATFNGEQDVYHLRIPFVDCNGNGQPDFADIVNETSGDCNANGVPDECDVPASPGFPGGLCTVDCAVDCNQNGVPDECEGLVSNPPEPEMLGVKVNVKNRYISVTAGTAGRSQAIRVRFVDLPPPFDIWNHDPAGGPVPNGDYFVGTPVQRCENGGEVLFSCIAGICSNPPPDRPCSTDVDCCGAAGPIPRNWFWAAPLECDPQDAHFMDWHGVCDGGFCTGGLNPGSSCTQDADCVDVVHIFHEGIVPSKDDPNDPNIPNPVLAVYDVQAVDSDCASLEDERRFSAPLTMTQARWGDICSEGPGGACTGPADGMVEVIQDVMGIIDKFQNINALQKARDGGAVVTLSGAIEFINCTFADNEATIRRGGAVFDNRGDAVIRNCILWNNVSPAVGVDEIYNLPAAGGRTTATHSSIRSGWPGAGNIDSNPLFIDVLNGDYRLQDGSPCRDVGHDAFLPADSADLNRNGNTTEALPMALGLRSRVTGNAVDMGAYEH